MVAFMVLIPVAILVLATLFLPARVAIKLRFRSDFLRLKIKIGLIAGLIPVNLRFLAVYSRGEGLYVARIHGDNSEKRILDLRSIQNKRKKKKKPGITGLFQALRRGIRTRSLHIYGRIGTGSPDTSVMLCGLLNAIVNSALKILISNNKERNTFVDFQPDFSDRGIILNLEGIFYAAATKIITVLLKEKLKKRKAG